MVARLFRLRVALLGSGFRGSFAKGLRTALLIVLFAAIAALLAILPAWGIADASDRAAVDTAAGATILLAVFVVPFFENRRNLEPRQFVSFPAGSGSVGFALLITTIVSWPFLLLIVWLVTLGIFRPEWHNPVWMAPVALGLAAILAVCSARVVSAFSKLVVSPRFAGMLRTVGALLIVAFLPVAVYAGAAAFGAEDSTLVADTAQILGWSPFGAPFAALAAAASGEQTLALLHLGVLAAAVLFLVLVWVPVVWVSNQRIDRPSGQNAARIGLGWFERFGARPGQVIAARQLTYWARDPRYRVALFAIPVAPILMLVAFWVAGADVSSLALLPLPIILLLLGWSQHNDVAMDSTAIWAHVASGTRGRADRAGRLAPVLMLGVPLILIGSSITVTVIGDWRVLPAVIGMNTAVLLVASGVASVFSVVTPYPATRPGDSPFAQPQWSGTGSGLAQTVSMLLALLLSAPAVWVAVLAFTDVEFMLNIWALAFGVGYGILILWLGILIGGRVFDRSGPELIAVTQVFD